MRLRVRLSVTMIALVFVTGLLLAILISKQVAKYQSLDHERWSSSLASALAKAVFRDTLAGNHADVIASLRRSIESNPEIAYLIVVDFKGRMFAEVSKLKQPVPIKKINHLQDQSATRTLYRIGETSIRDEAYPLVDKLPAHLHVGFDTKYEEGYLGSIKQTILVTTAVLLLITIMISLLIAGRISRPISQLALSLRNYGIGKLTPKGELRTSDTEVKELVDSFYSMTEQNTRSLRDLQDERNFIDAVLDNAGALVLVLDRNGRICRFNRACERLAGYDAKEIIGKYPWDTVLPPEEAEIVRVKAFEALKNDPESLVGNYSNHWRSKSGKQFLIDWHNTCLRDATGEVEYVVSLGTDITEKRMMENALRDSEAQARAVFEQAAVGIAFVALDGHWIDVNKRLCDLLGYERSFLLATDFQSITHPDDLDKNLSFYNQMINKEIQSYNMDKRYLCSDGSYVWTNLTVSLVRDEKGAPRYFISIIEDINDRKKAEVLLNSRERQLKEAQRIANMGSWELDLVHNRLSWSDEIFRMFEIDSNQFGASYEAFLNAIHPDDRDLVNQAYNKSLENKEPYEISHRLMMPDGRIKWVKERCESEFDADSKPLRSLGTVQDITEQVRIETKLRTLNHSLEKLVSDRTYELANERNFISTILDTADALVMVMDTKGRVVRVNRACENLSGYLQNELQGKVTWDFLVPLEQRKQVEKSFSDLLHGAVSAQFEHEWICKSGEHRLIAWSNSIIKNQQGEIEYVIKTGVDITKRKAIEQALILEKEKAEQASQAKSEFMSRMSHELRTPLNAILGFSQLLQTDIKSPLNKIQHENVDEILHAGHHLLTLINEVLDLSRIEAGHMQLNIEPVDIGPLLRTSVSLIHGQAEQDNISISMTPENNCKNVVMADPLRLKQVFLNLLSNAIKYNKKGGSVHVHCDCDDEQYTKITVTDTGDGISDEHLPLVFEPFERLDADIKAIPGTGIGLALSKRMMEMMGGTIGVESVQGEGSTFWIKLEKLAN